MNIAELELNKMDNRVDEELHELAYFKWLDAGKPEGRTLEFWCEAERDMFGCTSDEYTKAYDTYFREVANLTGDAYLRYHGLL
jgi:hypothetical protein